MSWWDYGYQITAMANRTIVVDNNTWNNTHISRVGQALASTEEKAYEIMRELDVNYVLVIFGGLTGYSSDGELGRLNRSRLCSLRVEMCRQNVTSLKWNWETEIEKNVKKGRKRNKIFLFSVLRRKAQRKIFWHFHPFQVPSLSCFLVLFVRYKQVPMDGAHRR